MTSPVTTDRAVGESPRPGWTGNRVGELAFALLILGLGIFTFVGTFGIRTPAGVEVGPRVFPILVAAILIFAGVWLVANVLRGDLGQGEAGEDIDPHAKTDWKTIGILLLLVLVTIWALEPLGWWMTAAVLFGAVAWALGARRPWLGFVIGLILGVATHLLFAELLGLGLPRGYLFDSWYGPAPLFG